MSDPTSLPNFPPPPEEHPLRGRVLDALQDMQLQPDLDADGDVKFVAQEQQLFVRSLEGGQVDIMRTFGQWQIAPTVPDDMLVRLNGCNDITLGVNLVKAGIAGGNLVLTVEQIVAKTENPRPKLQVSVGLLLQAVQLWHRNVVAKAAVERGEEPPPVQTPEGQVAPAAEEIGPWLSAGMPRPPQGGQAQGGQADQGQGGPAQGGQDDQGQGGQGELRA